MTDVVFALESDIGKFLNAMGSSGPGFWRLGMNALLNNIAQTMLIVGVAIATIFLIFGGIKWIVSGGDKEATAKAQKTITAAIVGLVIIFLTWAIVGLVKNILGIFGSSTGGPGGGGGGGTPSACLTTCKSTSCAPAYEAFCYKGCRCQCNHKGEMWSQGVPWCGPDSHQYTCSGSSIIADRKGATSHINLSCPSD